MKLAKKTTNKEHPNRIIAEHESEPLAIIYCDTEIKWLTSEPLPLPLVKQVVNVAENFNSYFQNIKDDKQ